MRIGELMLRHLPEALLIAFLAGWLAVSVLGQIRVADPDSRFQRLRHRDFCGLIPVWTFFAPRPAWTDYHLLYRDALEDGGTAPWSEVAVVKPRRLWHAVWNPDKHARKAVIDMVRTLTKELEAAKRRIEAQGKEWKVPGQIYTSLPYVALLNLVSNLPRLGGSTATQFLIMKRDAAGSGEAEVMMLSAFHHL